MTDSRSLRSSLPICSLLWLLGNTAVAQQAGSLGSESIPPPESIAPVSKPGIFPRSWADWREQDLDQLETLAPSPDWQAAVAYQRGDYDAAAEVFDSPLPDAGDEVGIASANQLRQWFNQATTDVATAVRRAGRRR